MRYAICKRAQVQPRLQIPIIILYHYNYTTFLLHCLPLRQKQITCL